MTPLTTSLVKRWHHLLGESIGNILRSERESAFESEHVIEKSSMASLQKHTILNTLKCGTSCTIENNYHLSFVFDVLTGLFD